jgi:flagellin
MALTLNTNLAAMNASRNLNNTENMIATAMQRLSSGLRINSSADDVAGYAISQSLQSQVNGLNQATQNIQDAVALAQTAQGALNDVTQMLQRVRELAVQYTNGTTSAEDKTAIEGEVKQLAEEIKRVGETTQFNGKNLLNNVESIKFQVGANDGETIGVSTIKLYASIETKLAPGTLGERLAPKLTEAETKAVEKLEKELGEGKTKVTEAEAKGKTEGKSAKEIEEGTKAEHTAIAKLEKEITEKAKAPTGIKELDEAIATVSKLAGEFGAVQDRIQYTQSNLEVYSQNLSAAVSAIRDVNMATEMTSFTKDQVLQQAGVSILAHANQLPNATLKLLE